MINYRYFYDTYECDNYVFCSLYNVQAAEQYFRHALRANFKRDKMPKFLIKCSLGDDPNVLRMYGHHCMRCKVVK